MLTTSCRVQTRMAPTANCWSPGPAPNIPHSLSFRTPPKLKKAPVSILKKADSDTSSTCSNSSMIKCQKGCQLKVLNTQINTHDCFERMRQELNDSYGKVDDLEEQLKLQRESHFEKEQILRNQIKRLRNELGIGGLLDVGEKVCLRLTRENRTFGFKLMGRDQEDVFGEEEEEEEGVLIASITHGTPAHNCGRIFIKDKILEINSKDVSKSTCSEVETLIRNSPDTMNLVLLRTSDSRPYTTPTLTTPTLTTPTYTTPTLTTPTLTTPTLTTPTNPPPLDTTPLYSTPRLPPTLAQEAPRENHVLVTSLPRALPVSLLTDEDFDRLSSIGLPEEDLDSSQDHVSHISVDGVEQELEDLPLCADYSILSDQSRDLSRDQRHHGDGESERSGSDRPSEGTDITTDLIDILSDAREYEEILLYKKEGMLGITLTYGADALQEALFVDSIKPGSPAQLLGKPLLHDQIIKINNLEVGVDILCDEAIKQLTCDNLKITLELARPKKHDICITRKTGQSLGMMVAVSKIEDDKSVIISTVDPNGLVAKYGLFKGLTLFMVNGRELAGLGLKQAVEILAECVGELTLTVFVHPNFSPYQPPRPPTPYPLTEPLPEDEVTERSVKFSIPSSPARSSTSAGSIDSLPRDPNISRDHGNLSRDMSRGHGNLSRDPSISSRDPSISSRDPSICSSPARTRSPTKGRSPNASFDDTPQRPAIRQPYVLGYGSPSINLINTDWALDRSLTADHSVRSLRASNRDVIRRPVRACPDPNILAESEVRYSSPHRTGQPVPTPHHSLNQSITTQHPGSLHYENLNRNENCYENIKNYRTPPRQASPASSHPPSPRPPSPKLPHRQTPPLHRPTPVSQRPRVVGRSPVPSPAPSQPTTPSKHRVMGRRERAAITGDRKVQFGGFRPIDPGPGDDEHYV